jgi:lipopolysaccharide export system permease protein
VDPVIALWVPFVLFAALSWWMYRTLAHVPGGQPIGALERVAAKSSATLRRWLRFGRRRRVPA